MIDLAAWIHEEANPGRRRLRMAMQLVLRAIAQSDELAPQMIMKGGVLLAIRYRSSRFTRDIDFSTQRRIEDVQIPALLELVDQALAPVSADNEHGLALALQSHEIKPPAKPGVNFPTLNMRIGYADRSNPNALKRLQKKEMPDVVQVDYSFNEWASAIEEAELDGGALRMYAFHDLVAEKLRSVLQQPIRGRERYQDIYDLHLLLHSVAEISADDRVSILAKLHESARDRGIPLHREALRDPNLIERSERQYATALPGLVAGEVPPFEQSYGAVQQFFEDLPWSA
jgi:predicted nucleotidyltransferase component of viral defense system